MESPLKEVKMFKTSDGHAFEQEGDALMHELKYLLQKDKALSPLDNILANDHQVVRILQSLSKIKHHHNVLS